MFSRRIACMLYLALASPALAHLHINMVAPSVAEGTPLEIAFYGNDDPFAIVDNAGQLEFWDDGVLLTLTTDTQVGTQYESLIPGLEGYQRAPMLNFTTDGGTPGVANLTAPNDRPTDPNAEPFGYQIVSVKDVTTGDPLADPYRVLWQQIAEHSGQLSLPGTFNGYDTLSADSSADDALGQTYILALGAHAHGGTSPDSGFFLFTNAPNGEYDITVRAVDVGGYFQSSAPVSFRLVVVPEPASLVLLGVGGLATLRRRR